MMEEVVIGLDPHKSSNTIAVLQRDETLLARRRFTHSDDGLVAMFDAVSDYPKRVWAVEEVLRGHGGACGDSERVISSDT